MNRIEVIKKSAEKINVSVMAEGVKLVEGPGKSKLTIITLFAAPRNPNYQVNRLNRVLDKIASEVPDFKKGVFVRQGTDRIGSLRFGYLYLREKLPSEYAQEENPSGDGEIVLRLYPHQKWAEFAALFDQSGYYKAQALVFGSTEDNILEFRRDRDDFFKSANS